MNRQMGAVRPEHTNARPMEYSRWHRQRADRLNFMTDIDSLEYRRGRESVALLEVKKWGAKLSDSQRKAQVDLADRAKLPIFLVEYKAPEAPEDWDAWEFKVSPLNGLAVNAIPRDIVMNEFHYSRFLSQL